MKWHWPHLPQILHRKKPTAPQDQPAAVQDNPTLTRTAATRAALLKDIGRKSPVPPPADRADRSAKAKPRALREITSSADNPGNLRHYDYLPASLQRQAPLVVLLHGCQQNAAHYAKGSGWQQLADQHGFALLLCEQKSRNNPTRCFNWFQPNDVSAKGGEAHSINAMTQIMISEHGLDPARIFISGLSAGGAMTSALLASHPRTFNAGAIIAGLPFGAATSMTQAFTAMLSPTERPAEIWGDLVRQASPDQTQWPRLSIWHGSKDRTVSPSNATALEQQWCDLHGIAEDAVESTALPRLTHRKWSNASGAIMVESILVAGLDHGIAIDAAGQNGPALGEAGPYFMDIGLSCTQQIARFWGLA